MFTTDRRLKLGYISEAEAKINLEWTGTDCDAEKYLRPMREPMRKLGHIGVEPIFFNWCAAFVTWCSRQAGFVIPDQPAGSSSTMALVDTWNLWGDQQGCLVEHTAVDLKMGDIVLYRWQADTIKLDHIGIFLKSLPNREIEAAEGNVNNTTGITRRKLKSVAFVLRLPDGLDAEFAKIAPHCGS